MYTTHHYRIDFEKVETIDDIKRVLEALDIAFEYSQIKGIEDLVYNTPKDTF